MSLTPAQHAELDRQITIERLEDAAAYRQHIADFGADLSTLDYDTPAGPHLELYPDAVVDAETGELLAPLDPPATDPARMVRELIALRQLLTDETLEQVVRNTHRVIVTSYLSARHNRRYSYPSQRAAYMLRELAALVELTGDARFVSMTPLPDPTPAYSSEDALEGDGDNPARWLGGV